MMKLLNKLRKKAWYWDVLCFIWCALLFILFAILTVPEINAQQKYNYSETQSYHYTPGVIGLSAMPASLAIVSLRDYQWKVAYGGYEPYMESNKLSSYNQLQRSNNQILLTGMIVTGVGIGIQLLVNRKLEKRRHKKIYTCHF